MIDIPGLFQLRADVIKLLQGKTVIAPESGTHLLSLAMGNESEVFKVAYNLDGFGEVVEATVLRITPYQ